MRGRRQALQQDLDAPGETGRPSAVDLAHDVADARWLDPEFRADLANAKPRQLPTKVDGRFLLVSSAPSGERFLRDLPLARDTLAYLFELNRSRCPPLAQRDFIVDLPSFDHVLDTPEEVTISQVG